MRRAIIALSLSAWCSQSCSSSEFTVQSGSAGTSSAGSSAAGTSSGGGDASGGAAGAAGQAGTAGAGGTGSGQCDHLALELAAKLAELKKCCAACAVQTTIAAQCTETVPGVCCQETVNQPSSSEAAQEYTKLYNDWVSAGCHVPCPAIPCSAAPSNTCTAAGICS